MSYHRITEDEKNKMFQCREMMFSDDAEIVKLGVVLADEEFGKYKITSDSFYTFSQIVSMRKNTVNLYNISGLRYWLYYAATYIEYLYYE